MESLDNSFWQGIILKLSFKPEKVKRTMAALIYVGLTGAKFTTDIVPKSIWEDNTTSGCAVRMLSGAKRGLGFLQCIGRVPSPAKTRHGAEVKEWRLLPEKRSLALTWLERNGFDLPTNDTDIQRELFSISTSLAQNGEIQPA